MGLNLLKMNIKSHYSKLQSLEGEVDVNLVVLLMINVTSIIHVLHVCSNCIITYYKQHYGEFSWETENKR